MESDWNLLITRLDESTNLYEIMEVLARLVQRSELTAALQISTQEITLQDLVEEVYEEAGRRRLWGVVRRAAALFGKVEPDLDYAVSAILVRQKTIQVGRAYSNESFIAQPLPTAKLLRKIETFCREDVRDRVLTQELLIYLGLLIKAHLELFVDLLMVRVSYLIVLLTSALAHEQQCTQDEAYDQLMHLTPSAIQQHLAAVLAQYQTMQSLLKQMESLHSPQGSETLIWSPNQALEALPTPPQGWREWRRYHGIISRTSDQFYINTWQLFHHTHGLIIGDKFERRNRLESRTILSDMTPGEAAFALRIEHLLNKISVPEYRQVNLEALTVLSDLTKQNPTLYVEDYIVLDVLISHAVRLAYLYRRSERETSYSDHKGETWNSFYALPPISTTDYLARSFRYLLEAGMVEEAILE